MLLWLRTGHYDLSLAAKPLKIWGLELILKKYIDLNLVLRQKLDVCERLSSKAQYALSDRQQSIFSSNFDS